MKGKMLNRTNGITLIALVVTIVVLLILAGITLVYVFGDNGIIKLAQKAKDETENAIKNEQEDFGEMVNLLRNEYNGGSGNGGGNSESGSGSGDGNNEGGGGNTTDPVDPPTPGGSTIVDIIDEIQKDTITVTDANKNPITIPGGFKVVPNSPEGTDASEKVDYTYNGDGTPAVQDGIVIEDNEGNQFVWIPIGEIKNKIGDTRGPTTTITLGRYSNFGSVDEEGNYTPAQNADDYMNTVSINGNYQELTRNVYSGRRSAKSLGEFVSNAKANKGYYLARYESSKGTNNEALSKANQTVWAELSQTNASEAARKLRSDGSFPSDLVNSYAWDTAIIFIQKYSNNSKYCEQAPLIKSDRSRPTGKTGDVVCNIHDMSSNCGEWTTEYYDDLTEHCVCRGGTFEYSNTTGRVHTRYHYSWSHYYKTISFRVMLY